MTRKQFMANMSACNLRWTVDGDGRIRLDNGREYQQCPIEAVYGHITKAPDMHEVDYESAAKYLGLSEEDTNLIVAAADTTTFFPMCSPGTDEDWEEVRRELLKIAKPREVL